MDCKLNEEVLNFVGISSLVNARTFLVDTTAMVCRCRSGEITGFVGRATWSAQLATVVNIENSDKIIFKGIISTAMFVWKTNNILRTT